jgi:plastocyanin domain-containing protein
MRSTRVLALSLSLAALAACKKESSASSAGASDGRPTVEVKVGADGYHPSEAKAKAGQPVRLLFTRTTDEGCGQELVFPSLNIRKPLPLNEPVAVDVTMPASGKLAFTCGMDMFRGSIVAE